MVCCLLGSRSLIQIAAMSRLVTLSVYEINLSMDELALSQNGYESIA
jgi:hypothetical protein